LGAHKSPIQASSWSVQPFFQSSPMWQTQTHRPRYIQDMYKNSTQLALQCERESFLKIQDQLLSCRQVTVNTFEGIQYDHSSLMQTITKTSHHITVQTRKLKQSYRHAYQRWQHNYNCDVDLWPFELRVDAGHATTMHYMSTSLPMTAQAFSLWPIRQKQTCIRRPQDTITQRWKTKAKFILLVGHMAWIVILKYCDVLWVLLCSGLCGLTVERSLVTQNCSNLGRSTSR